MKPEDKIAVLGSNGMAGSAIVRELETQGYKNILRVTRKEADLTEPLQVKEWFSKNLPKFVFLAAAKVGGIKANDDFSADFIRINLQIQTNAIEACRIFNVEKLLFLGSSCIYPKDCPQPIREEYLLTGELERTNEAYAVAKIAGLKMCQHYNKQYGTNFICCMPTNLYGPGDNYNLDTSHVLPALIAKVHFAKTTNAESFTVWGSGKARREFLFVNDFARACVHLMNFYCGSEPVNIGTGQDISIADLAATICKVLEYEGQIVFDAKKPDGTARKLLNVDKILNLGWKNSTPLEKGIAAAYEDFLGRLKSAGCNK